MPSYRRAIRAVALILGLCALGGRPAAAQEEARSVSLEEALRLFAENNPELRGARADADAAWGRARQSRAYPHPAVTVTRESLERGSTDYTETYYNLSQRITWPWTLSARGGAAGSAARAAEARARADSLALAFEVKRAYLDALVAESRSGALREAMTVVREVERSGRARFARGDISGYHVRRLALARARYESALAAAELDVGETRRALASLILPPEAAASVRPADTLAGPPPAVALPEGEAWADRPELAAAEAELAAARQSLSAARRERLPELTLTGGYKTQSDDFDGIFLSGSLPVPIFDRNGGAIDEAAAVARAAEARLARERIRLERDVRAASDRYRSLGDLYGVVSAGLMPEAAEVLRIARAAYGGGELSLLELLDATDAYRDARVRSSALLADYWTAYYDLERALGGLGATGDSQDANDANERDEARNR